MRIPTCFVFFTALAFVLTAQAAIIPAPDDQEEPSVAANGNGYFVVWADKRTYGSTEYDIYGTRMSATGEVLDPTGIPICTDPGRQTSPRVAFDGERYLVVWEDDRESTSAFQLYQIYGARVSVTGAVLDHNGFKITTNRVTRLGPAVASDGHGFFVAWEDWQRTDSSISDVYGSLVSSDGVVANPDGIPLVTGAGWQVQPRIAFANGEYLVTYWHSWTTGPDIWGIRVSPVGQPLSPVFRISGSGEESGGRYGLASNGRNYFVVWGDYRGSPSGFGYPKIYGTVVRSNGVVVSPNGIPIATTALYQDRPRIASDGNAFLVVWQESNDPHEEFTDIYGAKVTEDGTIGAPVRIEVNRAPGVQRHPDVAFTAGNYLVAWQDGRSSPNITYPLGAYDIYGTLVSGGGAVSNVDGILISGFQPNEPPMIGIINPKDGDTFTAPVNILLMAFVHDEDGLAAQATVEFFDGTNRVGAGQLTDPGPPHDAGFRFYWTNVPPGTYVLTARVTDSAGAMATSSPVKIIVRSGRPVVNVEASKADAYELGDSKSRALIFRVTRTDPIDFDLPVSYRVGGTAQNGVDYEELGGRMIIPVGAREATILTYARFDEISEGDETVEVAIERPPCIDIFPPPRECYQIGEHGAAHGIIHDAPPPPPVVWIGTIDPATSEPYENGFVVPGKFLISRTGPTNGYLLVFLQYGGTASNGVDYRELPRWFVEIPAGRQSAVLDIVALADTLVEGKETVDVKILPEPPDDFPLLIPIQEYRVDTNRQSGRVIIFDRQTPFVLPTVSIEATVPEAGECAPNQFCPFSRGRLTIRRSGELDYPLPVHVAFEGTAIRGVDYGLLLPDPSQQGFSHILTLPAGQSRWDLLIDPIDDLLAEGDETATLRLLQVTIDTSYLFPPADYKVDPDHASATVVIHDNDPFGRPVVSLESVDPDATETLTTQNNIDWAEFRVRRTGDLTRELFVFLNTQQGSARLGEDYRLEGVNNGSAVRFPVGASSVNVRLYPIDDDFYEGDETVFFHLIAPPAGIPLPDQYDIDFAHSSVAMIIHDNDPVATRLDITAPRNGQQFQPGDTIVLRAQIIGPGSSNSWSIDFFDGEQRLGTTRPGAPIWWGDAPGGQHVISARATDSQGMVLTSTPPVTIRVGPGAALPIVKIGADPWKTAELCPNCSVAPGVLTIERTAPTNAALTVFLQIDGTATAGDDYQALPASVEIPAGQRSAQLNVLARDDQLPEGPEVVRVRVLPQPPPLLPPTYFVNVYANEALVVIFDVEPDAPQARLDIIAPANGSHLEFPSTVELSALAVNTQNEVYGPVEFYAGDQFIARSTVTASTRPAIPGLPSVHTGYWTNPPVGQHVLTARTRLSFSQSITSPPVNVTVDSPLEPVVRLETLPLQNAQAREFCPPNMDCAYPSFVVRRSGPINADLRVYLSYSGTATAGVDYPLLPESVVIPAGRDAVFLMVVPKNDTVVEGPETVIARFTAVPGPGYIQDPNHASATITIIDDERPLDTVVSIGVDDPIASETSILTVIDPARFRISRTGDLSRDELVFFSVHGSATAGTDYPELNSSIRIAAGESSITFNVTPRFDQLEEGMETVLIRLEPSTMMNMLPTYDIDPARRDAVAIILDNGSFPTPGLEIVRPEEGDRFTPPASIEIVAAAYHPTRDIGRVDFYAGAVKIGESLVVDLDPSMGGLIVHRFTWTNPPAGVHLLTARGFDGTESPLLTSKPIRITVGPEPPQTVVRIEATQPIAEEDSTPFDHVNWVGEFTISRTGPTNASQPVFVQYSGSATAGEDYPTLPWLVSIPSGATSTMIRVMAINDSRPEGIETVVARVVNCLPCPSPTNWPCTTPCIDFDIDPAHEKATVFIRDDGITTASLVITRPQDGASFQSGETIRIEATAIDLDGYIGGVEFWDGEQKIGVSGIVSIPEIAPGTPARHSFEWRGAAPGPHTLTARATRADGTALQSQPVRITVGSEPPGDRELHVIGVYSGTVSDGGPSHHNERGDASLTVNRPGKRITLFLSSYEPVLWHVTVGEGTIVEKVILGGYYRQSVEGLPSNVEQVPAYYEGGNGNYLYIGDAIESAQFYRTVPKLCALTGLHISSFQGRYQAPYPAPFVIDRVQDDVRLRCDYPQPVPLSELPNVSFRLSFHNRTGGGNVFFQNYTLGGPQNATRLLPAMRVLADNGGRFYYGTEWQSVFKVDSHTGIAQEMVLPPDLAREGWPMGVAFDSARQRVLVVSLGAEGFLHAYSPAQDKWSLVTSMNNLDLDCLEYHASGDALYGVGVTWGDYGGTLLYEFDVAGALRRQIPLPVQPFGIGPSGYRSELVSVGDYLVLLLEPDPVTGAGETQESRMYLIDPRSGHVWLTYRRVGITPNRPPVVAIVTPQDGARFDAGATIELGAHVTDPDGNLGIVTKVEFFANGRKIGEALGPTTAPISWLFAWTNVASGEYILTAKATDILGAAATSLPVRITVGPVAPVVRIEATSRIAEEDSDPFERPTFAGTFTISRTGPTTWPLPVFIHVSGSATPGADYPELPLLVTIPEGAASKTIPVVPVNDDIPEGIETIVARISNCPPPWSLMPCVDFEIDRANESATVFIRDDGITTASLMITRPRDGARFPTGHAIPVEAFTIDLNGYISRVEFWDGEQKIGVSEMVFIQPPGPGTPLYHSFEWQGAAPGTHVLTARAVNSNGAMLRSPPVRVTVEPTDNQLPRVAITRPVAGAQFPFDTAIEIFSEARDPDGYVPKVEFFADGRKIGERNIVFIQPPEPGQTQTFAFVWNHPTPGPHVLTARATDDDGATASSAPVEIRITGSDQLPIVSLVARDAFAVEPASNIDLNTAVFRIRRFGPTNGELRVSYSLGGTAQNGVDYETLSGLATIPAGQRSTTVTVRPLADNLAELIETVILRLEDPPGEQPPTYRVGFRRNAVALISDKPLGHASTGEQCVSLHDGLLHFCFPAQTGQNFRLEASSDLRNWETVFESPAVDGAFDFVEDEETDLPHRFYRLTPEPVSLADE